VRHYELYSDNVLGYVNGYAELDWLPDGNIKGRFCRFAGMRQDTFVGHRLSPGRIQLKFDTPRGTPPLPKDPFQLIYVSENQVRSDLRGNWASDNYTVSQTLKRSLDKERAAAALPQVRLVPYAEFKRSDYPVVDLGAGGQDSRDREDPMVSRRKNKSDVTKLDGKTLAEFEAFVRRTRPEKPVPGVVRLIYVPAQRPAIERYLASLTASAKFNSPEAATCGIPYIEREIKVPDGFEFYFAEKLQSSGFVLWSYPRFYPPSLAPLSCKLRNTTSN
jgi:hypothetical protein